VLTCPIAKKKAHHGAFPSNKVASPWPTQICIFPISQAIKPDLLQAPNRVGGRAHIETAAARLLARLTCWKRRQKKLPIEPSLSFLRGRKPLPSSPPNPPPPLSPSSKVSSLPPSLPSYVVKKNVLCSSRRLINFNFESGQNFSKSTPSFPRTSAESVNRLGRKKKSRQCTDRYRSDVGKDQKRTTKRPTQYDS